MHKAWSIADNPISVQFQKWVPSVKKQYLKKYSLYYATTLLAYWTIMSVNNDISKIRVQWIKLDLYVLKVGCNLFRDILFFNCRNLSIYLSKYIVYVIYLISPATSNKRRILHRLNGISVEKASVILILRGKYQKVVSANAKQRQYIMRGVWSGPTIFVP